MSWSRFAIPDGEPEIELARLRDEEDGAFTVLVRFPPGWQRAATGSYDAAEEALVLDGALRMSGRTHRPGDFARWGAGYERAGTRTPDGATVLAWFSGPNRWSRGPTGRTQLDVAVAWHHAPTTDLGPLGRAHVLADRDDVSTLVWPSAPVGAVTPRALDLFAIETRRFAHVPASTAVPELGGAVFGRIRGRVHDLS